MRKRRVAIMIDLDHNLSHHQGVFIGTQEYFGENGQWETIIDPHADTTLPTAGSDSPYDGVIGRATKELEKRAERLGIPVVNVWLSSPATKIASVIPDFYAAGELAARHFLDRGLRRFGFLGFSRERSTRLREDGFTNVARKAGIRVSSQSIFRSYSANSENWNAFMNQLDAWIDRLETPVGIFAAEDLPPRYLAGACLRKGLRIPEDVAIIGLGNEMMANLHPAPAITSIDLGYETVGYAAAKLLNTLAEGGKIPKEPVKLPPRGIVVRQSTDVFAIEDPVVSAALRFIASSCVGPLSVPEIATAVSTTRRTLERRFRSVLGHSVNHEINRLRLEVAKQLLITTEMPIYRVATESGFSSSTHLSVVFRRMEGMAPMEYRGHSEA